MNTDRNNSVRWIRRAALAAVAAVVLGAAPAWADPVLNWNYTVSTTFADPATGDQGPLHPLNSGTLLCWGTPGSGGAGHAPCPDVGSIDGSNRSALKIDPATRSGNVNTVIGSGVVSANIVAATTLTHYNNPILASSNELTRATLQNAITLQAVTPPGSLDGPWTANFNINFIETSNTPGTCVAPPNSNPCSDIFVLGANAMNQSFVYEDGNTYWLHFWAIDGLGNALGSLTADQCNAAGAAAGCYGFITQEGMQNPMRLGLAISTERIGVPEPGALGIMGLGILGIGLAFGLNRRRNRREA